MILPQDAVSIRYEQAVSIEILIDMKKAVLYDIIGAFNILTDTAIISLSIRTMWKVHVLVWKRLVVITAFSIRFL